MPTAPVGLGVDQPFQQNCYVLGLLSHAAYAADPASHSSFRRTTFADCTRFSSAKTGADGFVTSDDQHVVIVFRGTEEPLDALTDASFGFQSTDFGKVHVGFWNSVESVWKPIERALARRRDKSQSLWITGHSLGAAMASIAAVRLAATIQPITVATFGQPRTGGSSFAKTFRTKRIRQFRFVNNDDIVPTIPPRAVPIGLPPEFYEHVGDLQFFDAAGKLVDKADQELGVFPTLLSAVSVLSGSDVEARRIVSRGVKDHAMERYVDRLSHL